MKRCARQSKPFLDCGGRSDVTPLFDRAYLCSLPGTTCSTPHKTMASARGNCYSKCRMILLCKLALAVGSGLIILALL